MTFSSTIVSAITSLAPFWSNELVKSNSLGSEYTMAISMILGELIKLLSVHLTDFMSLILVFVVSVIFMLKSSGLYKFDVSYFIKKNKSISVTATEKTIAGEINLMCSDSFKAINKLLIQKYNFSNLRYLKDQMTGVIVDVSKNVEIDKDLFVTITKTSDTVNITLSSYTRDLHKLLSDAITEYGNNKKYSLQFVGTETNGTSYCYPETMEYLTYVLVNFYKMNKLKILHKTKDEKFNRGDTNSNTTEHKKTEIESSSKSKDELKLDTLDDVSEKNIFLLENCLNYVLDDDITITIERNDNIVRYILSSDTKDLKEFINTCLEKYKFNINTTNYKYKVKLTGREKQGNDRFEFSYPKKVMALCNRLITNGHVKHFRTLEHNGETLNMIDKVTNLIMDGILINVTTHVTVQNWWDNASLSKLFVLESNDVDIGKYLEECEKEYDEYLKTKHDNILYYFKYLGKVNGELKFSKTVLEDKSCPLYETFDGLHSEHTEMFRRDIKQLKNLEYYKKTCMRRKKGYVFYGEPGCGKNATVVAMALEDRRHIIDIPFNILQYNSEFYELMNITLISGVGFTKSKVIYMFDEFHAGLEKICGQELRVQNMLTDQTNTVEDIINSMALEEQKKPTKLSYDTLDLSCILTTLDGISNYGGAIYIGLTNFIDKIPDALKRSLRLTPVYFTFMRQCDAVSLIESSYDIKLDYEDVQLIPDRKISPAKLRMLCDKHYYLIDNVHKFIETIVLENNSDQEQQIKPMFTNGELKHMILTKMNEVSINNKK